MRECVRRELQKAFSRMKEECRQDPSKKPSTERVLQLLFESLPMNNLPPRDFSFRRARSSSSIGPPSVWRNGPDPTDIF